MKNRLTLLLAFAAILGGAHRLAASEELAPQKCCTSAVGAQCCGDACSAGFFRCYAT